MSGRTPIGPVRLRARRRILELGLSAAVVIAVCAFLSVAPLTSGAREGSKIYRDNVAIEQLSSLRSKLAAWQFFAEPFFATFTSTAAQLNTTNVAMAAQLIAAIAAEVPGTAHTLDALDLTGPAAALRTSNLAFTKSTTALGPLVTGQPAAVIVATVAAERRAFARIWAVASASAGELRQIAAVDLKDNSDLLERGRVTVLVVDGIFAAVALGGAILVGQRTRSRERTRAQARQRRTFETLLQDALEMSTTEGEAYALMGKALVSSVPRLQSEVLVADSSRAHFHRVVSTTPDTDPDKRDGCGVTSPLDCPATIRGHTLRFESSRALNACPYLQGRPSGDCSAVCVPISLAGKTVGVVHATGPEETKATAVDIDGEVGALEVTARRVSERVAMLRAFEKSETQARSDPLTGLLNRRSLANRVHNLQSDNVSYALAYGDLDHFKVLNDTHGHEAGDQALRLFARVLRDSVRPDDIVCRYGGEEFVVVLPDCSAENAVAILERLRERLTLALTSGRVPPFTASFGVSQSNLLDTFDEIVATADRALLAAKSAGRNRVILADGIRRDA
jgi:diguanylate cyclase (GGDEF)-like protein